MYLIPANSTEKATQTQSLRLTDALADPDVFISGLFSGPEQLRVFIHGAQRRPQPYRLGAVTKTP